MSGYFVDSAKNNSTKKDIELSVETEKKQYSSENKTSISLR